GEAGDPRRRASLDALGAGPLIRRGGARALMFSGRDLRSLRLGGSGAGEHQLRAGLACREGRGEEPANQEAEASSHWLSHWRSVEAPARKGKARRGLGRGWRGL